jgi:GWxTD domain-containing protein
MKYLFNLLLISASLSISGQPLRDINYKYLYNPGESFSFNLKPVRESEKWTIFYKLQLRDTSLNNISEISIQWELRESLIDKANVSATPLESTERTRTGHSLSGEVTTAVTTIPKIIVAKVMHEPTKRVTFFYRILEANYPVNTYITSNAQVTLKPYVTVRDKVQVEGSGTEIVSYYDEVFPPALPPFAEGQVRVSKGMKLDSTFSLTAGQQITFSKKGLYLVQHDTSSAEGVAFRVEDDYPRLAKIESLAGPLIYICTKQEYDRLVLAKNDKKAFDRIILGITNDTDRAKKLFRNYFRRVELANQYFTSYKEGWKTDRGMIYVVFGLPDEVFKFSDREVWNYKNEQYKATFNFAKSSSVFDPDNYVLIREKKLQDTWYEVIDLWRNARF